MKALTRRSFFACTLLAALAATPLARAQTPEPVPAYARPNQSVRQEVEHAIDQGLTWLKTQQRPEGHWSNSEQPALTALVMTAYFGDPSRKGVPLGDDPKDEGLRKAHDYLMSCVHPDGGIYGKGLTNYNTSICLVALLAERNTRNDATLRQARRFVVSAQYHGPEGDPGDGGFAYDPKNDHSDVSNTVWSMEALHLSKGLLGSSDAAKDPDLDVKAALGFLERCQSLPDNKGAWQPNDEKNRGGFIYRPAFGRMPAGAKPGDVAPKSPVYGTMTYAGLLSYIYADLKPEDPRVKAAHDWLLANYTVNENPGMGKQGQYYYYNLMAKALAAYGTAELDLPDGKKVDWREDLALKLINLQSKEGSWQNEEGRWWEKDPVLATAYSLIALEYIARRL